MNSNFNFQTWCPYSQYKYETPTEGHYLVDVEGNVAEVNRDKSPDTQMPDPPKNGGLYGGEQSTRPWAAIPVVPTATNYIYKNLRSANPPPGATSQYVSLDRFGNNYSPMPEVKWYNPASPNNGLYKIKGV